MPKTIVSSSIAASLSVALSAVRHGAGWLGSLAACPLTQI
jgi:hypothetical protein